MNEAQLLQAMVDLLEANPKILAKGLSFHITPDGVYCASEHVMRDEKLERLNPAFIVNHTILS